jgi:hypothetical protein
MIRNFMVAVCFVFCKDLYYINPRRFARSMIVQVNLGFASRLFSNEIGASHYLSCRPDSRTITPTSLGTGIAAQNFSGQVNVYQFSR